MTMTHKKANKAPEATSWTSRLVQSHESRQSLVWLIFDVSPYAR